MKEKEKFSVLAVIFLVMVICLPVGNALLHAETNSTPETAAAPADKEKDNNKEKDVKKPKLYYEVTVTATRTKKDTFEIPKAVSVVNRERIREKAPNNVTELLTELPGVDMNGVGANQSRPIIRGFRGQRILLMEDGIRMNNSRRQQDFGEIPALVDISDVDRVEVVRGPASVLYGSDAIGGVLNIITRIPDYDPGVSKIHGNIGYRYSSADRQNKGIANINGNIGKLGFMISGNLRKANDYTAPAGTFGDITLTEEVTVIDSGVKDNGINLQLIYNLSKQNQISFKYEYYHSENAGFGLVEPEVYDPDPFATRIQIRYPMQEVQKYSVKYENRRLGFVLADHISFITFYSNNQRELTNDIFVRSPMLPPGAAMSIKTENYTDINTMGLRLEFNKGTKNHTVTYGVDFFRDSTENTDTNITQMIGFGPPIPMIDNTPRLPYARYGSLGVFIQDDISLFSRTSLILGLRYQNVNARTLETPGLENEELVDSTDGTLVGAANLLIGLTDDLRLVLSVGRGFRSPNLIERFFNGATPEGRGFQARNTELKAETSLNVDVGFKYRRKNVHLEATYFNNVVRDGIRLREKLPPPQEEWVQDILKEYTMDNVDKLRMQGVEALARIFFDFGLSTQANFTYIKSKDLGNPETPYVDTYSSKLNLNVRYHHPSRFFWLAYDLRINGKQKDVLLGDDNPLGDIIPGFAVHSISAGITLFRNSSFPQRLGIIIGNLTNELYSEFSNASFFRPAPKRHIVFTWSTRF